MSRGTHLAEKKKTPLSELLKKKNFRIGAGVVGAVLIVLVVLLIVFSGGEEPQDEVLPDEPPVVSEPPAKPQHPEEPPEPPKPSGPVNLLVGMPTDLSDTAIGRRPVAIMINNLDDALPQLGISKADIIIEMLAEGRISRFVALYQDPYSVGEIGSVRSLRPYFLDMAQAFDAIMLHFGGSEPAYSALAQRSVTALDGVRGGWEGSLYIRDAGRRKTMGYEHSVITSGERIGTALATLSESRLELADQKSAFEFSEEHSALHGFPAENVSIESAGVTRPYFEFDTETGQYLRYQYGGQAQIDAAYDNTHLGSDNLIVLQMKTADVPGSKLLLITITTTGSGNGWYYADGKGIPIKWSREKYDAPLVLTLEDGNPLLVKPGKTFISCIPTNREPVVT